MNTKLSRLPRLLLAGLVALLVLAACTTSDPVTRLTLSTDAVTLAPGETAEVTASLKTRAGADHLGPVVWASADEDVATVAAGTITAVSAGETVVTASFSNLKAEVAVTVTAAAELEITGLRVTPGHLALILGELTSGQLTAAFEYEDGSTGPAPDVTWSSASAATATVSNTGAVTAVAAGSTRVTASAAGFTATANLTVVDPVTPEDPVNGLEVVPGDVALLPGGKVHVIARFTHESGITSPAVDVTWSSNADGVATVEDGEITAVAAGTAQVTATASGQTATVAVTVTDPPAPEDSITGITVSPASLTLDVFEFDALSATFTHASGATSPAVSANWSSSDDSVVTASAPGILQATGAGTATVTVSSGEFTATASITVVDPVVGLVIKPSLAISIEVGDSITLAASTVTRSGIEADVTAETTWTSLPTDIVTVTGSIVTAIAGGVAEITANYEGLSAVATVSISSNAHAFVGNLPDQPAGPLGNPLNPFRTIADALAVVDDDATITLLPGWDGIEATPVVLINHTLIGAGVDESTISLGTAGAGCFVISLGGRASVSDLRVDGTNVMNTEDTTCSGSGGARGIAVMNTINAEISNVRVFDGTAIEDETQAEARRFAGIHAHHATELRLTNVEVINSTRDAIQINGSSVVIDGVTIRNAAQFQPGYGGFAIYGTSTEGSKVTARGDWQFLDMPGSPAIVISSYGPHHEISIDPDFTFTATDVLFPLGIWRGLQSVAAPHINDLAPRLSVTHFILDELDPAQADFMVATHLDAQHAVDMAIRYTNADGSDAGASPVVLNSDYTELFVGQSSEDSTGQMNLSHAIANAMISGRPLNVLAGDYSLPETNVDEPLRLSGSPSADTNITLTGGVYGFYVTSGDVHFSNLNIQGAPGNAFKVQPNPFAPSDPELTDISFTDVTVTGSGKTQIDFHTVSRVELNNVTAIGSTDGVGISFTNSSDLKLSGITTEDNVWGGIALFDNAALDSTVKGVHRISITQSELRESAPLYTQLKSEDDSGFEELIFEGFSYAVRNPDQRPTHGDGHQFTHYFETLEAALSHVLATPSPERATIQEVDSDDASILLESYHVAEGMSISQAVSVASAVDAEITVSGEHTVTDSIKVSKPLTIVGGPNALINVKTTSGAFEINGGGAGSTIQDFTFNIQMASSKAIWLRGNATEVKLSGLTINGFIIDEATSKGSGHGITIESTADASLLTFTDSIIKNVFTGLYFGGSTNSNAFADIRISDVIISNAADKGMYISTIRNALLENITITNAGNFGREVTAVNGAGISLTIEDTNAASNVTLRNVTITDSGGSPGGGGAALTLKSASGASFNGISLIDTVLSNTSTEPSASGVGLQVGDYVHASSPSGIVISGGSITGSTFAIKNITNVPVTVRDDVELQGPVQLVQP